MSLSGGYRYEGSASGTDYYIKASEDTDNWEFGTVVDGVDEPNGVSSCLIVEGLIDDELADTYTVTADHPLDGTVVFEVTRTSLCVWDGVSLEPNPGIPVFITYGLSYPYKWEVYFQADANSPKDDPQSQPDGTYQDAGVWTNIVVSL